MADSVLVQIDSDLEEFRRRLRVRVRRSLREALGDAVGGAAFRVVRELRQRGPMSPADLSALLEVRSSTMAAHLDRLEDLGWARRETLSGTNRVRVVVTDAGSIALERYTAVRRAVLEEALRPLSHEQLSALADALRAALQTPAGTDNASEGD